MTREELFEAIGEVDETLVEETRAAREGAERMNGPAVQRKRRRRFRAPAAAGVILAACAAAAIAIPAVRSVMHGNGSAGSGVTADAGADEEEVLTGGAATPGDAGARSGADSLNGPQPELSDFGSDAADAGAAFSENAAAGAGNEDEQAAAEGVRPLSDSAVGIERMLELNGCYYEVIDRPSELMRYGLPARITADMAGGHVAWLVPDGAGFAETTQTDTDPELFEYAPAPCRGVYVLFDGYEWNAAVFCGFVQLDSNMSTEMTELFRMYGIEGAEDIALMCETDRNRDEQIGEPVTDPGEIAFLYEELTVRDSYGNDDFQTLTFDGIPEEEQPGAHAAFADDMHMLRIETADGLRFYLEYYPSYGWLYGQGTMSWYRAEGRLAAWLNERFV